MSCEPPVNGRVNAIKSQFENLRNFETLVINEENVTRKLTTKGNFQRSATSIDLVEKATSENKKLFTRKSSVSDFSRIDNSHLFRIAGRKTEPIKSSKSLTETPTQPKSIKQKPVFSEPFSDDETEIKLSRHTNDPVKRSSIKRSPAFRVGEKNNKTVLLKQSPTLPKEFDDNTFGKFLAKKCSNELERMQQPGLTDSLKAALRQPLPNGPPPKKPPRTFGSPTSNENPIQFFEQEQKKQLQQPQLHNVQENNDSNEIKGRINFLENRLVLKKQLSSPQIKNTTIINSNSPSKLQKSKTELVLTHSSKLLDCLSCHKITANVYDSMTSIDNERRPLMQNNNGNIVKRFSNSVKPAEPIYMEPFSHLKSRQSENRCEKIEEEENMEQCASITTPISTIKMNCSINSSNSCNQSKEETNNLCCSCSDSHNQSDLHYLCTAIDDSVEDTESSSAITQPTGLDKEGNLGKSYDEITILVDAAFKQKSNTMGNRSSDSSEGKSSVRLSRTLTEKRKDYVRRISVMPQDNSIQNYGTLHRTFKSPVIKTFSLEDNNESIKADHSDENLDIQDISLENNELHISTSERIDKYKKLIEDNNCANKTPAGGIKLRPKRSKEIPKDTLNVENDDDLENANNPKLFQVCLLVGYNISTNSAYLKWKYPPNEPIPDNIEQLIFPDPNLIRSEKDNQEYCLILTDDNGFKIYGYCRRVMAENSDVCLPMCYCIISITKALGFYQKMLKEIESRHGQSESHINFLLANLQRTEIPKAGKYLHIKLPLFVRPKTLFSSNHKISPKRLSLEVNPKWLTESAITDSQMQDVENMRKKNKSLVQEFAEKKQQNPFDFGLINRSLIVRDPRFDEILIRRPTDLRLENTELSELLICLGPELLINVFSNLLLERKVILQSRNISLLSKSVLALQTILYPFQWQYTIVTILPSSLIEICQAPFPVLVGILDDIQFEIEDGIVVDLNLKRITQTCGDEQTIIPDSLRESLQLSLEMVDMIDQGKMLSNVLISEAFLRFFIELFGDYQKHYYHKEEFIQVHKSQNIKFFLEWFVETSMFRHLVNDRFNSVATDGGRLDDFDDFYKLFNARMVEKSKNSSKTIENIETIVKNSKIINKKGKTFKERFKQFF